MRISRKEIIVLLVLLIVAIAFRYFVISDNNVFFYFDQSRDSFLATPIVHGDLKIQGPSASGSNDILYHGVMYYYIIGPLYGLFHGNPFPVSLGLGILNALAIIPLYILAKRVTSSKRAAALCCLLFALSFEASQLGTWLSNPNLAFITILILYLSIWLTFFESRKHWLLLTALGVGLSNQAMLSTIYLFFVIAGLLWYRVQLEKSWRIFPLRLIIASVIVYLGSVSTMILTQAILHKDSLGQLGNMFTTTGSLETPYNSLQKVAELYSQNLAWPVFPFFLTASAIVALVFLIAAWRQFKPKVRLFMTIWFFGPLSLLLFIQPNAYHTLMGLTALLYLACGFVLFKISTSKYGSVIVVGFLVLFTASNFYGVTRAHGSGFHIAAIQRGALLNNQLEAIDQTYKIAGGGPFSISTLAVPYGFNTTWAYLYNWYGRQKYGYLPEFYGPSQNGIFAGDYLKEVDVPEPMHFTLYEPTRGLPPELIKDFSDHQASVSAGLLSRQGYGTITVEQRQGPMVKN